MGGAREALGPGRAASAGDGTCLLRASRQGCPASRFLLGASGQGQPHCRARKEEPKGAAGLSQEEPPLPEPSGGG